MMGSLESLLPELLVLILEHVDDSSPRTIRSLALTNRYLYSATRFISNRRMKVKLGGSLDADAIRKIESWIESPVVRANLRALTVQGWLSPIKRGYYPPDGIDIESVSWDPLVKLISEVARLEQFTWDVMWPLPIAVLDAIEQHQESSTLRLLNLVIARPHDLDDFEPIVYRLAQSSALTHIRYTGGGEITAWRDPHMIVFRFIVASAPKLKYVSLEAGNIYSTQPRFVPIESRPWRDTPVTDIPLYRKILDMHRKPNASVRQLSLSGPNAPMISKRTLDDWSTVIDLNSLETVKLSGSSQLDYYQHAVGILPNLNNLSLNLQSIQSFLRSPSVREKKSYNPRRHPVFSAILHYISNCPRLQTLSLYSWSEVLKLQAILERHGPMLRSLCLHDKEVDSPPRKVLSLADIKLINSSCPSLQRLTIDLARTHARLIWEGDPNKPIYNELAHFDHLDSLEIHFDNGYSALEKIFHLEELNKDYTFVGFTDGQDEGKAENIAYNQVTELMQFGPDIFDDDVRISLNPSSPSSSTCWLHAGDGVIQPDPSLNSIRPSHEDDMICYAEHIWITVFGTGAGHRKNRRGERRLEVKFGDWRHDAGYWYDRMTKRRRIIRRLVVQSSQWDNDVDEPWASVYRR